VPTIYGGQYAWDYDNATNGVGVSAWPLWLAAYTNGYNPVANVCALGLPSVPGAWSSWSLWQFTSVASVFGIAGHVDLSVVEPAWWETYTGQGIVPAGIYGDKWAQPVLVNGSIGPGVINVQRLLTTVGLYRGPISGTFDDATEAAVQAWQTKLGILPDGAWGPATIRSTNALFTWLGSLVPRPVAPLHYGELGRNRQIGYLQHDLNVVGFRVKGKAVKVTNVYDLATVAAVHQLNLVCPGVHTWPGRQYLTRQAQCLNYFLTAAGK
jgi:hypothetical protein